MVESRYTVLRVISAIYKILGVIVLGLAILIAFASLLPAATSIVAPYNSSSLSIGIRLISFVATLIGGGSAGLSLYALGEAIQLFVDLEENTRENNVLLEALEQALTNQDYIN